MKTLLEFGAIKCGTIGHKNDFCNTKPLKAIISARENQQSIKIIIMRITKKVNLCVPNLIKTVNLFSFKYDSL